MSSASFPLPVFMKNCLDVPSGSLLVILAAEAELIPPPMDETLASAASRWRSWATAESSFMLRLYVLLERCRMDLSIDSVDETS